MDGGQGYPRKLNSNALITVETSAFHDINPSKLSAWIMLVPSNTEKFYFLIKSTIMTLIFW